VIESDDRHRRFRRDAFNRADDELIDHQIADDEDGTAREAVEQLVESGDGHQSATAEGTRSAA
jgi:hypothetical protein